MILWQQQVRAAGSQSSPALGGFAFCRISVSCFRTAARPAAAAAMKITQQAMARLQHASDTAFLWNLFSEKRAENYLPHYVYIYVYVYMYVYICRCIYIHIYHIVLH